MLPFHRWIGLSTLRLVDAQGLQSKTAQALARPGISTSQKTQKACLSSSTKHFSKKITLLVITDLHQLWYVFPPPPSKPQLSPWGNEEGSNRTQQPLPTAQQGREEAPAPQPFIVCFATWCETQLGWIFQNCSTQNAGLCNSCRPHGCQSGTRSRSVSQCSSNSGYY